MHGRRKNFETVEEVEERSEMPNNDFINLYILHYVYTLPCHESFFCIYLSIYHLSIIYLSTSYLSPSNHQFFIWFIQSAVLKFWEEHSKLGLIRAKVEQGSRPKVMYSIGHNWVTSSTCQH
jgi:hypothetical protein